MQRLFLEIYLVFIAIFRTIAHIVDDFKDWLDVPWQFAGLMAMVVCVMIGGMSMSTIKENHIANDSAWNIIPNIAAFVFAVIATAIIISLVITVAKQVFRFINYLFEHINENYNQISREVHNQDRINID